MMLSSTFSARGRSFILLLFMSLLLSGPLDNTLENTERAASSLLCGAEVAANQTKELMQKAATPLFCKTRPASSNPAAGSVTSRVKLI